MHLEIYLQPTKRIILLMFTQLKKTFNSTTERGRANVAKATYGAIALIYLFVRMRRKKAPPITADCQKSCVCPGAEGGGDAAAAAAVTSAAKAEFSNGVTNGAAKGAAAANAAEKSTDFNRTGVGRNDTATFEESQKPCKRVDPKDMSPLKGRA